MNTTAAFLAGLALAWATAAAAQQTDPQYEPETVQTQDDQPTGDPEMGTLPEGEQDAYGTETGERAAGDLAQMSPEQLKGMTVTTSDGEEIGTIEDVGYSSTRQEQVAAIDVGGFLGVGQKTIAVPLSELRMGSDDSLMTDMSRDEIQSEPEFDASTLETQTSEEQSQQEDW